MDASKIITIILNSTISATKETIPLGIEIGKPLFVTSPIANTEYSVLIGITGDIKGRLVLETSKDVVSKSAEAMFGMSVEGEMLASFFGELGNMVAGSMCTKSSSEGVTIDITPPTVMCGNTTMYGIKKAFKLPITVDGLENTFIILSLE